MSKPHKPEPEVWTVTVDEQGMVHITLCVPSGRRPFYRVYKATFASAVGLKKGNYKRVRRKR